MRERRIQAIRNVKVETLLKIITKGQILRRNLEQLK